ncbi:hypothetical protein VTN49DRAFT_2419 [Thermomyces lanuginosus]|uniref:uncharacterized protein n=1 Tax=Thermomyces lanuginosus TaxID=5541 RepID=UPI003742039E
MVRRRRIDEWQVQTFHGDIYTERSIVQRKTSVKIDYALCAYHAQPSRHRECKRRRREDKVQTILPFLVPSPKPYRAISFYIMARRAAPTARPREPLTAEAAPGKGGFSGEPVSVGPGSWPVPVGTTTLLLLLLGGTSVGWAALELAGGAEDEAVGWAVAELLSGAVATGSVPSGQVLGGMA